MRQQTYSHRSTNTTARQFSSYRGQYATDGSSALSLDFDAPLHVVVGSSDKQTRHNSLTTTHNSATSFTEVQKLIALGVGIALTIALFSASLIVNIFQRNYVSALTSQVELEHVYVRPGQSLWELAEAHPIESLSTQEVVRFIQETNQLESSNLLVGQELIVPLN